MDKVIEKEICNVREWVKGQIIAIKKYPYEKHRIILYCSIIDSFVQNNNNYIGKYNQNNFAKFLIKYSKKYSEILNRICPTTFYEYDEKLVDELGLTKGRIYNADDEYLIRKNEEILKQLNDNKIRKHTYASLIYSLRNKLVHEMVLLNPPIKFDEELPYICCEYIKKNEKSEFLRWRLNIPEKFIINVLIDSIDGYLEECKEKNRLPFCNNSFYRNCYVAWYDKK